MENVTVVSNMFTSDQITSISTALNTAVSNVLSMFVALLPVVAIITGVGFGISLVMGLFSRTRHGGR